MKREIITKYNIPVPRYTSYPPASFFHSGVSQSDYIQAIEDSNGKEPHNLSFYIHFPFCKRLCHYCGCNAVQLSSIKQIERYKQALIKEFTALKQHIDPTRKIAQIHYGGGSPSMMTIEMLKELNEMFLSSFQTIKHPEIAIECHPGYLDEPFWSSLKSAGFTRISVGCQDISVDILHGVNRKPSALPIEQIADLLRQQNLPFSFDFIYGLPGQTAEHMHQMMSKVIEIRPNRVVTFSYAHVPWVNPAMKQLEMLGLPSQEEKQTLFAAAQSELLNNGYVQIGMDHFVLPNDELYSASKNGMLYRNFQGYCSRATTAQVYAMGCSAISQLTGAFFQNYKDVDEYLSAIESQQIPLAKGYLLSQRDQLTAWLIMQLMCNNQVDLNVMSEMFAIPFVELWGMLNPDMNRFREMQDDGLVIYDQGVLKTTAIGAQFVRNVASVFDQYYQVGSPHYSKPI